MRSNTVFRYSMVSCNKRQQSWYDTRSVIDISQEIGSTQFMSKRYVIMRPVTCDPHVFWTHRSIEFNVSAICFSRCADHSTTKTSLLALWHSLANRTVPFSAVRHILSQIIWYKDKDSTWFDPLRNFTYYHFCLREML